MSFSVIRPRVHPRNVRDVLKSLMPEPDDGIVKRLISYYSSTDYSIRFPWSLTPASASKSYDLENIKDYARVLTMLKDLKIFPPPFTQSMGGVPSRIVPSFDGPLLFTPSGTTSQRSLNAPQTEDEVKQNTLSSEQGGLADAAEGLVPEVFEFGGQDQVIELQRVWSHSRPQQQPEPVPQDDPLFDEEEDPMGDLDNFLRTNVLFEEPLNDVSENIYDMENNMEPFEMNIIRPAMNWSQRVRRRLPWTRISQPRIDEIELQLTPAFTVSDEDLEEEPEQKQPVPANQVSWWRNLSLEERRRRFRYIKLIATYLLVPTSLVLVEGLALHRNLESQIEDPLMTLYYKLPSSNWFKANLSAMSWAYIITKTDRALNLKFISQVGSVINFTEDCVVCWVIQGWIQERNDALMRTWHTILQDLVAFRSQNKSLVTKEQTLFSGFEWCYVAQAVSTPLVLTSFVDSKKPPSQKLLEAVKQAKEDIKLENRTTQRTQKFVYLLNAFQEVLDTTTDFFDAWTKQMNFFYETSYFYETFSRDSFQILLYQLSTKPQLYPPKARDTLSDFLHRFSWKPGSTLVDPFSSLDQQMRYEEDPSRFILQLLTAMDNYYNDHKLDTLAYLVLNKHIDSEAVSVQSWGEAVQVLGLPKDYPAVEALQLISSVYHGVAPFMKKIEADLKDAKQLPELLPSVHLFNQGIDADGFLTQHQIAHHSRSLSSTSSNNTVLFDFLDTPRGLTWSDSHFVKVPGFLCTISKDILVAAFETVVDIKRIFNVLAFKLTKNVDGILESSNMSLHSKPIEMTMSQNSLKSTGAVLKEPYWLVRQLDYAVGIGAGLGIMFLTDNLYNLEILLPIAKFTGDLFHTAIISYSQMQFKSKVIIGTAAGVSILYGPKEVIRKATDVVESITNGGTAFLLIGALGIAAVVVGSKRQKLF